MKLNVAFHTLLVAISAASGAHARATSFLRDPRTVEGKEPVQRQTMGDFQLPTMLKTDVAGMSCEDRLAKAAGVNPTEKERSLACSAVSKDHSDCLGCQGFSQVGKEVHIPGCVGMTPGECYSLAHGIVLYKPGWFKDRAGTKLVTDELKFVPAGEMTYYKLGLPVSARDTAPEGSKEVVGVAGNCMVHYSWDWCVPSNDDTMCLQLQPWDCSASAGKCLSSSKCCAKIQGEYPKPDINNNELQCYEWVLPVKSSPLPSAATAATGATVSVSSGGLTGNRLVIHVSDNKVALPAVITDGNYEDVHDEDIIVTQAQKCLENCPTQACPNKSFPNDLYSKYGENLPKTLEAAVKAYVDQDCANKDDCTIGQEWGYPINSWCVEKVTSFSSLFASLDSFNEDINSWTTCQVTEMKYTFDNANAFNQPLNNWKTSCVRTMDTMFHSANAFNQPLDSWDISLVSDMNYIFVDTAFNQNLCEWGKYYAASGVDYSGMFSSTACPDTRSPTSAAGPWCQNCKDEENSATQTCPKSFPNDLYSKYGPPNKPESLEAAVKAYVTQDCANHDDCTIGQEWGYPINSWCVEKVTSFSHLFYGLHSFNEDINGWTTGQVIDMSSTFEMANAFNQPLDNWDVSSVLNFDWMFMDAFAFNQDVCQWGDRFCSGENAYKCQACP